MVWLVDALWLDGPVTVLKSILWIRQLWAGLPALLAPFNSLVTSGNAFIPLCLNYFIGKMGIIISLLTELPWGLNKEVLTDSLCFDTASSLRGRYYCHFTDEKVQLGEATCPVFMLKLKKPGFLMTDSEAPPLAQLWNCLLRGNLAKWAS